MADIMRLEGFAELDRNLEKLSKAAGKGALRRALKTSASSIADAANAAAPQGDTGEYAKSFAYSKKLNDRQRGLHRKLFRDDRAAVEGFVGTNDPAGVQQEFGNINHVPQPALRPAWDAEALPTLDRLKTELADEIDKSVARAARRNARS